MDPVWTPPPNIQKKKKKIAIIIFMLHVLVYFWHSYILLLHIRLFLDGMASILLVSVITQNYMISVILTMLGQSPNDHLQDSMGILHMPYDNISTTVPLHPTCSPIRWKIMPVNSDQYTNEITNVFLILILTSI
jgi:hypothetical protein